MKKIFFTLITLNIIIMTQAQAQSSNLNQIEHTISQYFDGMINHNSESIVKAFEPSAPMKWNENGTYMNVNAVEALSEYVNTNDPVKVKTSIVAINITGDAANAQLELEYETFFFVDFMHLLKIDGQWKIVSKTYTTKPKGEL